MKRQKRSELDHRIHVLGSTLDDVQLYSVCESDLLCLIVRDTSYVIHAEPNDRVDLNEMLASWMVKYYQVLAQLYSLPRYASRSRLYRTTQEAENAFVYLLSELRNAGFVRHSQPVTYSHSIR